MLLYRVISAMVGIPAIIAAIWYGGWFLFSVVVILVLLGLKEFFSITSKMNYTSYEIVAYLGGIAVLLAAFLGSYLLPAVVTTLLITSLIYMVVQFPQSNFASVSSTVVGVLYVALLFSYLLQIRLLPAGAFWLIFLFVLNWTSDTVAYFVGRAIGKNKLAPKVSPNKTIEGSFGGIFGATLASLFLGTSMLDISILHLVFLGVAVSAIGQLGDLAESALKRKADVKDSGKLIPGHGGVLDRFDSILLTAPLLYFYILVYGL